MFRCPFMPCMNCPYSMSPEAQDMHGTQNMQDMPRMSNIPPSTPIPNVSPLQQGPKSNMPNTSPIQQAPLEPNVSPLLHMHSIQDMQNMPNIAPIEQLPKINMPNIAPVEQAPKPNMPNTAPVQQAPKPNMPNTAPVQQAPKPNMPNTAPVQQAPKPNMPNTAPVQQAPKPNMPNMPVESNMNNMNPLENIEEMHKAHKPNEMYHDNNMPPMPEDDPDDAFIRVLHASPDAPPVDIFIDGSRAIDNLAYGMLAGYVPISSGRHKLEVFPANRTKNPVITATLNFAPDSFTTIALVGYLANIEPLIINDYEDKVPRNQAMVKFVHMSPNAPAVDITLADGKKLFTNISFKQATDYIMVAPGVYGLQVRLAGTNTIVLTVPNVSIQGGIPYSIYAIGLAGGKPPLAAVLVEDEL